AQLRLRAPGETPGPLGPFASPGEPLVVPLQTQDAVRDLVAACGRGRAQLCDGACLTAWTLSGNPEESEGIVQLIEPMAARRAEDRSLAVEPIELVAERQGSAATGGSDGAPLRFGEGFRLRAAGCSGLYLGYSISGGGLQWLQAAPSNDDEAAPVPPHGTRLAAHGGELGGPLLFGRPLSLRRVPSPPASDADSESDDDLGVDESESEFDDPRGPPSSRQVRFGSAKAVPQKAASKKPPVGASSALLPEAARYAEEGLFSRLADQAGAESAFPATFLPLFA
ncbi:unnamed protein product, partial [Polarella glacialis]